VSSSRTETDPAAPGREAEEAGPSADPAAPGREAEEAGGTLISVEMPKMGISVSEGTILEWRKQPGDWVEADETIADVTTDKVDVEIPSPSSGRLARIVAEAGDTVEVGAAIAEIDADARAGEAHPEERSHGAAEPASPGGQATPPQAAPAPEPAPSAEPAASSPEAPSRDLRRGPEESPDGEADRSRFYSPVVRRIADKHDVDLSQVRGTGIGGRVRKRDVLAHVENGQARPAPVLHSESPYRPDEPEPAAPAPAARAEAAPVAEAVPGDGERREAMSAMRRAIARHMVSSRQTAAHCTTVVEVDMSRVAARRRQLKEQMARRGVGLTYLAFVARATVETLEEFPILNASVDGEEIVYHEDVNLGIAVALESGLIVPVIRRAQRLSLEGMAAEIGELAERARAGKLAPDDVHGGTFTITNPGQFGAVLATPIINQPQVAILDLEAIVKRPVVVEGPEGDSIAIRPMAYLPLSFDHRALDGADAARFMARVKARLEGWEVE
jgi:2-oxoglutarate dehydrogenase dihydrolipoamide succinyltransferase (E2 component)